MRCVTAAAPAGTIATANHLTRLLRIPEGAVSRQQFCQRLEQLPVPSHCRADVAELLRLARCGVGFYHSRVPKGVKELLEKGMKAGACVCVAACGSSRNVPWTRG
jgi:hypothetical protein